jgi:type I restriction enzyme S subunit
MSNNNNRPKVRFVGHNSNWTDGSVSDLVTERNRQAPKSLDYPLMAFVASKGVTSKGARYNREFLVNDQNNKKYKQTEHGDFIYSSNNLETGSIGLNKHGHASISPVYSIFEPSEKADPEFIGRMLSRKVFIQQMVRWRQGVVYGQWRIHESDFLNIKVKYPDKTEQKKIGGLFQNLDDLIAYHTLKFNKLKILKSSLLQKMFPENESKIPELCFKELNNSWKPKEFSSIVDRISISSTKKELPRVEYEDIISGRGIFNKDINRKVSAKRGIEFKSGDVLFGKLRPYLKNWFLSDFDGIAVGDFWALRAKEINEKFLYYLIQTNSFQKISNQSSGSKMPRSDWSLVSKAIISIPSDYNEQTRIGELFWKLDQAINLNSQELEKLKNFKKACSESMFAEVMYNKNTPQ